MKIIYQKIHEYIKKKKKEKKTIIKGNKKSSWEMVVKTKIKRVFSFHRRKTGKSEENAMNKIILILK